jgi:hypothetical protein
MARLLGVDLLIPEPADAFKLLLDLFGAAILYDLRFFFSPSNEFCGDQKCKTQDVDMLE